MQHAQRQTHVYTKQKHGAGLEAAAHTLEGVCSSISAHALVELQAHKLGGIVRGRRRDRSHTPARQFTNSRTSSRQPTVRGAPTRRQCLRQQPLRVGRLLLCSHLLSKVLLHLGWNVAYAYVWSCMPVTMPVTIHISSAAPPPAAAAATTILLPLVFFNFKVVHLWRTC
jgi:hypothetical protein